MASSSVTRFSIFQFQYLFEDKFSKRLVLHNKLHRINTKRKICLSPKVIFYYNFFFILIVILLKLALGRYLSERNYWIRKSVPLFYSQEINSNLIEKRRKIKKMMYNLKKIQLNQPLSQVRTLESREAATTVGTGALNYQFCVAKI